jgi:hypothetical protein
VQAQAGLSFHGESLDVRSSKGPDQAAKEAAAADATLLTGRGYQSSEFKVKTFGKQKDQEGHGLLATTWDKVQPKTFSAFLLRFFCTPSSSGTTKDRVTS